MKLGPHKEKKKVWIAGSKPQPIYNNTRTQSTAAANIELCQSHSVHVGCLEARKSNQMSSNEIT